MSIYTCLSLISPCYMDSCHLGMVHPQIMVGGDSFQMWRVAVNIQNKQSQTPNKRLSFSLGSGWRATTLHHNKPIC